MIILPNINTGPISQLSAYCHFFILWPRRNSQISLDSKLSLPCGRPPCGSETIHPNFRLVQNDGLSIEGGGENRYLSRRNLFSKWSGLREKSAPSDDFKIPIGTGISHPFYSGRHSIWGEVGMEKASRSMHWFGSLC
jgi:hypothetical protein